MSPGLHRGSAGAPPAYNRGSTGSYRGITVDNLGSTAPYRHEPGLHRAAPYLIRGEPGLNRGYLSLKPGQHRGNVGTVRTQLFF